jgi:hypothetical protein
MRAAIDVGKVPAVEIDQQRLESALAPAQGKFLARPVFNLA